MPLSTRPSEFIAFCVFFRIAVNAHSRATDFDLDGIRLVGISRARKKRGWLSESSSLADNKEWLVPKLAEARRSSRLLIKAGCRGPDGRPPGSNRRKRCSKPSSATSMGLRSRSSNRADRSPGLLFSGVFLSQRHLLSFSPRFSLASPLR